MSNSLTFPVHSETIGIYIHIPFCRAKCVYCNFKTFPISSLLREYICALVSEVSLLFDGVTADVQADTLYFGGGTPSVLTVEEFEKIMLSISEHFRLAEDIEITIEANPEDVTPELANCWKKKGVNRVSFGLQTVYEKSLSMMNRRGRARDCTLAVDFVKSAGIENINIDLIVGLPMESRKHWLNSLSFTLDLEPKHISLYILEEGGKSVLAHQIKKQHWYLPTEEEVADFYLDAVQIIESRGFEHYEISNFARKNYRSRHNQKYWALDPYIGLGAGAHSFHSGCRWQNQWRIKSYIEAIKSQRLARNYCIEHDRYAREKEFVFLGLRRTQGINLGEFKTRFGRVFPQEWLNSFKKYIERGLLIKDNDYLRLTRKGFLLSNEILQEIF